jgi:signal transduction histidine kinase
MDWAISFVAIFERNFMSSVTGLILIVDDTPTNLEVLSAALGDAGFDVAIATDGERALQRVDRRLPDLILLDVMMPGINGFETCRRLKANPRTCEVPIIFMTALTDADSRIQALELGAVDYITKPFHEREVLARVRTHLQLYQFTQSLTAQVAEKTAELQASQLQLIQNEKMSTLGNLVAGIAHEINNPIGCIVGNVNALQEAIADLFSALDLYHATFPDPGAKVETELAALDLDYLRKDLPQLIQAMRDSSDRITTISKSLRTFSRTDQDCKQSFNLNEGIDSTLLILRHRFRANEQRPEIRVILNYGELPLLECFPGQLNQVFMNLLANAIDAIDESNPEEPYSDITNQITICTVREENYIKVAIADNAKGMSEEVKARIFDQQFTTKAVGKGTGLGLAISQQIIVEKHGGTIHVTSAIGQGSEFVVTLPLS